MVCITSNLITSASKLLIRTFILFNWTPPPARNISLRVGGKKFKWEKSCYKELWSKSCDKHLKQCLLLWQNVGFGKNSRRLESWGILNASFPLYSSAVKHHHPYIPRGCFHSKFEISLNHACCCHMLPCVSTYSKVFPHSLLHRSV